jgi:hypothetical protein
MAMIATGSGVAAWGVLLRSSDGAIWQRLAAPSGGPVEFVSPTTGWLTPTPSRTRPAPGRST